MTTRRSGHTATLLPDGRLLIVGGGQDDFSGSGSITLSTTEQWTPDSRRFRNTNPIAEGRSGHTAILLSDGRVLIVGGVRHSGDQQLHPELTEIWDPQTGRWKSAGVLARGRDQPAVVLLADGRVMVSGGDADGTTEIWEPTSMSWVVSQPMLRARYRHTATVLSDGRVLLVGGSTQAARGADPTAEIWTPATGQWTFTGALHVPRQMHSATKLQAGEVLVVGGRGSDLDLASAEIWHPETGIWSMAADELVLARERHQALLLPDNDVLIIGGFALGRDPVKLIERWDAAARTFRHWGNASIGRYGGSASLLQDGTILFCGGIGMRHVSKTTEILQRSHRRR